MLLEPVSWAARVLVLPLLARCLASATKSSSVIAVSGGVIGPSRSQVDRRCDRYAITGSNSEGGEVPVWHVRLYSIQHKILAFFAFLILGVLLLGGVAITLSHRMHTSTVAVRDETQDIRWND